MGAYLLSCPYPELTKFSKMESLKMLGKFFSDNAKHPESPPSFPHPNFKRQ